MQIALFITGRHGGENSYPQTLLINRKTPKLEPSYMNYAINFH